jgi:hypothetical protein
METIDVHYDKAVLIDLSVLMVEPAESIFRRLGESALIVPMDCFQDVLTKERGPLGDRKQRLFKLFTKIQTLAISLGVPIKIVDWDDAGPIGISERAIDALHFLSHDFEAMFELIEHQIQPRVTELTEAFREATQSLSDNSKAQRFAISAESETWVRRWANNDEDVSNGKLIPWMGEHAVGSLPPGHDTPILQAMHVIYTIIFLRSYGRPNQRALPRDDKILPIHYDQMYAAWSLRYGAELWTKDKALENLSGLAVRVARHTPFVFGK